MSNCMLCDEKIGWSSVCKKCGFIKNLSKIDEKKGVYHFQFLNNITVTYPLKLGKNPLIEDFAKEHSKKILEDAEEKLMNIRGYYKGEMCPFAVASVGGPSNPMTIAMGGPSIEKFTWTHFKCMKEYCALWSKEDKMCSFKIIPHATRRASKNKLS